MFAKIESWLTLGNRYVSATMVYLGIALLLAGSTLLDSPNVLATNDLGCSYTVMVDQEGVMVPVTYDGCPAGFLCCEAEATCQLESDFTCCENEQRRR
jgi:hypothetical protein